ncbi:uncharacterized protein LOC131313114 [Rhododendron vialii]|uniref:uncharacterized protein LOC131313114 n=1 Tax=Rhododendron vialii TaxID=182163 RepID=UPI00265FDAC1|nr:uncharacterized protein LOC131313114 [Rhododendron vialii]
MVFFVQNLKPTSLLLSYFPFSLFQQRYISLSQLGEATSGLPKMPSASSSVSDLSLDSSLCLPPPSVDPTPQHQQHRTTSLGISFSNPKPVTVNQKSSLERDSSVSFSFLMPTIQSPNYVIQEQSVYVRCRNSRCMSANEEVFLA